MKTVYRYTFEHVDDGKHLHLKKVTIPFGAEIKHIDAQYDDLCLWAEVDPDVEAMQTFYYFLYPTGVTLYEDVNDYYEKTIVMDGGRLVWHLYRAKQRL